MDGIHDILVDGYSLYSYYSLIPKERPYVSPAKTKTNRLSVYGSHGDIVLDTYMTGYPTYERRTGSWEFIIYHSDYGKIGPNNSINIFRSDEDAYYAWLDKYNYLMTFINGREHEIRLVDAMHPNLPEGEGWYYKGVLNVGSFKNGQKYSTITIDYDLEPFRYSDKVISKTFDISNNEMAELFTVEYSDLLMYSNYFKPVDNTISGPSRSIALPVYPTITVWSEDVNGIEIGFINDTLSMNRSDVYGEGVHDAYRFTITEGCKFLAKGTGRVQIDWRNRSL